MVYRFGDGFPPQGSARGEGRTQGGQGGLHAGTVQLRFAAEGAGGLLGLPDGHPFQPAALGLNRRFQQCKTGPSHVLDRGIEVRKLYSVEIQVLVVEAIEHGLRDDLLHAVERKSMRLTIARERGRDGDFDLIVVAVPGWVVAPAEDFAVLFCREFVNMQAMRRCEFVAVRQRHSARRSFVHGHSVERRQLPFHGCKHCTEFGSQCRKKFAEDFRGFGCRAGGDGVRDDGDEVISDDAVDVGDAQQVAGVGVRVATAAHDDFIKRTEAMHGRRACEGVGAALIAHGAVSGPRIHAEAHCAGELDKGHGEACYANDEIGSLESKEMLGRVPFELQVVAMQGVLAVFLSLWICHRPA